MQKHRKAIVPVLVLIVSLACRVLIPDPTPTPVTVTEPPAQTEPPAPSDPVITDTPPGPTGTPAPTSLNATGPYIVYGGTDGVWISNPDGSFLKKITNLPIGLHDLRRLISPKGDRMALVVSDDAGTLDLMEVKIPGGETKKIADLYGLTNDQLMADPISAKAFATYAIRDYDNVAWQPGDGKLLAFMGAMDGPTSDLYLYDTESGEITQLTDGLSQGIFPNWSPDGKNILHYGVSWKGPFGGALVGYDHIDGVWAVRVSDGKVTTLPTQKGVPLHFVGWQDDSHYITYDSDETCFSQNLRSVDIITGKETRLMEASFYYGIARSTDNQALLFAGAAGCPKSPGEGIFILLPGQTVPTKLLDKKAYEVRWLPESKVFQAYPEALFSSDGSTRYDPPVYDKSSEPAVSRKGYQAWQVIENQQGRVEVKVPGEDWQKIYDSFVGEMIWDPASGETLLFTGDDNSLYVASYPDFTPRPLENVSGVNQIIWLP